MVMTSSSSRSARCLTDKDGLEVADDEELGLWVADEEDVGLWVADEEDVGLGEGELGAVMLLGETPASHK